MSHIDDVKRYNLQKYDRIEITVRQGRKNDLKEHIKEKYIDTCIDKDMTVNKLLNQYIDRELNGEAGKGNRMKRIELDIDDKCFECKSYYENNDTGCECQGQEKVCHEFIQYNKGVNNNAN